MKPLPKYSPFHSRAAGRALVLGVLVQVACCRIGALTPNVLSDGSLREIALFATTGILGSTKTYRRKQGCAANALLPWRSVAITFCGTWLSSPDSPLKCTVSRRMNRSCAQLLFDSNFCGRIQIRVFHGSYLFTYYRFQVVDVVETRHMTW
ncbi:hypothetical protein M3J09_009214 [Ascochyta lentis]